MRHRALCAAVALFGGRAALAEDLPMTAGEFALWKDYTDALEDERVIKLKEKDRLPAIARNFKVSEMKLREALRKGEAHGGAVGSIAEKNARAALDGTGVAPRLRELRVDTSKSHVVTYVTWRVDDSEQVEEEASLVAVRCAKAVPLASTLALRAVDGGETRVFSALISSAAAFRIKEEAIADYADTRLIKLFEKVERGPARVP